MAPDATLGTVILPGLEPLAVPLADLTPFPGNPRRGDVDAIARSLDTFGQRKPIVVTADGTVVAGNHTVLAARQLGWDRIAAVRVDDDETTAKAYNLADNRTAELGGYDEAALAELMADLKAADAGLFAATGWADTDLDELLASLQASAAPAVADPDAVPAEASSLTATGDEWLLGGHRLICGDCEPVVESTDPATVALLLADPPYGVNEQTDRRSRGGGSLKSGPWPARQFEPIEGDDKSFDPAHLLRFKRLVLFGANHYADRLPPSPSWIVWDKLDGLTTDKREIGFCNNADAELAWTNLGGPVRILAHRWTGLLTASEIGQSRVHPTQKPVELMRRIIEWRSDPGGLVLDPYAGSGSVLIACEIAGRPCLAIEIEPRYCDVICRRWERATGTVPVRAATGEAVSFEVVDV